MCFSEYTNVLRVYGQGSAEERAAHDLHYGVFISDSPSQRSSFFELTVFDPLDAIAVQLNIQTEEQRKVQAKRKQREEEARRRRRISRAKEWRERRKLGPCLRTISGFVFLWCANFLRNWAWKRRKEGFLTGLNWV